MKVSRKQSQGLGGESIHEGKVVVVTGAANGIGCALATRFAERGAAGVVVADLDGDGAHAVAERVGGFGVSCDVGDPESIKGLVSATERRFGPIDVFCSNAGYSDPVSFDLDMSADAYRRIVDVNLLAHVWAAQAVVPGMIERGGGYLVQTISAAALITGPSAPGRNRAGCRRSSCRRVDMSENAAKQQRWQKQARHFESRARSGPRSQGIRLDRMGFGETAATASHDRAVTWAVFRWRANLSDRLPPPR